MKVPLLDLKPQYLSLKKEIDDAIAKVVESQHFILGPEVENMEKKLCEYLGCEYAIGVSSGTDALLVALMAIDIKPGDEVIVPDYSFFATAGVVARLNAVPVFADVDPVTFNINTDDFKKKITAKTKAVVPVHLYGQSCEMDSIVQIASDNNIKIIEDAAQAIGVQYKDGEFVGTIGDIGCFSFFPSKNLGCFGDGGLVTTNNKDLADKLKMLRVHGGEKKYYHKMVGGNFRLDALQAAVISVKLPHLDSWSEARRKNASLYTKYFIEAGLSEEEGMIEFDDKNKVLLPKAVYKSSGVKNYHIYNQYIIRVRQRDKLKEYLTKNNIGNEIYYPVPFHQQECFSYLNYSDSDFPVSENLSKTTLALPVYPELSEEQIKYVVEKIDEFVKGN